MNLILGLLAVFGAIALLTYQTVTGDRRFMIRNTNISAAWLLLVLSLYNFARWWSAHSYRKEQQRVREDQAVRLRKIRDHDRPPPDPTFDFTDEPPAPAPNQGITNQEPPARPEGNRETPGNEPKP